MQPLINADYLYPCYLVCMTTPMQHLLGDCLKGDRVAQRSFYEHFKGKMFMVCLRYADNREDAEDILQEGFVKVFRDLHQYKNEGSLEGWIRKVVVNVALQFLKRKHRNNLKREEAKLDWWENDPMEEFQQERIDMVLKAMQEMPVGFRTVLNLHILEGYQHKEIADMLEISIGTSKSQLNRAKAFLKSKIEKSLL
ncbi:MAG: RNA polymerase sigma factor [Saprospiraceae bacterium]|nr:RNA polymerase sigma factor [Saprospiraceae bacterium]